MLKPNGRAAAPLRFKTMDVHGTVYRQFAVTRMDLTFQNELPYNTEADLIYTLPPGGIVTAFTYWFGDERVDADIVEKKQAVEIYHRLTYVEHVDPGLVEQLNKKTFRVRISPVMGNSDLKVELTLAQSLSSDKDGVFYNIPLVSGAVDDMLDSIRIDVRVQPDPELLSVVNNYGMPVTSDKDGYAMSFADTNFRPQKDFRVNLAYKPAPLQALAYGAPVKEGDDGFFAMALTPDQDLRDPQVTIRGMETYDVLPQKLKAVRAHHSLVLVGRYRGSGEAEVTLSGNSPHGPVTYTRTVEMEGAPAPANVASRLWAAQEIEALESQNKREETMAISFGYKLPSRYTSWLALPHAEKIRLAQQNADPELNKMADTLSKMILAGEGDTPAAQDLRAKYEAHCKEVEENPNYRLGLAYDAAIDPVAGSLDYEIATGRGDGEQAVKLRQQLAILCARTGRNLQQQIDDHLGEAKGRLAEEAADALAEAIAKGGPDSGSTAALKEQYERRYSEAGSYSGYGLETSLESARSDRVKKLAEEIAAGREQGDAAKSLQDQVDRLTRAIFDTTPPSDRPQSIADHYSDYELQGARATATANQLAQQIREGQGRSETGRQLYARLREECGGGKTFDNVDRFIEQALNPDLAGLADQVAQAFQDRQENTPAAHSTRARFLDLCAQAGIDGNQEFRAYLARRLDSTTTKMASALAREVVDDRPDSAAAQDLRTRLDLMAQQTGQDRQRWMKEALEKPEDSTAQALKKAVLKGKAETPEAEALRSRLAMYCRETGEDPHEVLGEYLGEEIDNVAGDLGERVAVGDSGKEVQRLQARLQYLCRQVNLNPAEPIHNELQQTMEVLADRLMVARYGGMAYTPHEDDPTAPANPQKPNPEREAFLLQQLARVAQFGGIPAQPIIDRAEYPWNWINSDKVHDQLNALYYQKAPVDAAKAKELWDQFLDLNTRMKGKEYAQNRTDRLRARLGAEQIARRLENEPNMPTDERAALQKQEDDLVKREHDLQVRMGDPLIPVYAPADARQVIARMPDGALKPLSYNPAEKRWEARFDVPADAASGDYVVTIFVVLKDGTRQVLTWRYRVNLAPPSGVGTARAVLVEGRPYLRLNLNASADTARVTALLPWNAIATLQAPHDDRRHFFALVPIPAGTPRGPVQFILTSLAHSRAVVRVEVGVEAVTG